MALARAEYDFILLDTPPNPAATTTIAAYSIAQCFLLSVFPHPLSVAGLNEAFKDIADVRARRNDHLEVLGVVMTAVDHRTNLWREVAQVIEEAVPGRAFDTVISQSVDIAKVAGIGRTLFQTRIGSRHEVAGQYRRLTDEILQRVLNRQQFIAGNIDATTSNEPPAGAVQSILNDAA